MSHAHFTSQIVPPRQETNMRQFVCKAKLCRLVATQTVRLRVRVRTKPGNEPSAKFSKSVGTFSGLKAPTSTFTLKNQEKALVVCRQGSVIVKTLRAFVCSSTRHPPLVGRPMWRTWARTGSPG